MTIVREVRRSYTNYDWGSGTIEEALRWVWRNMRDEERRREKGKKKLHRRQSKQAKRIRDKLKSRCTQLKNDAIYKKGPKEDKKMPYQGGYITRSDRRRWTNTACCDSLCVGINVLCEQSSVIWTEDTAILSGFNKGGRKPKWPGVSLRWPWPHLQGTFPAGQSLQPNNLMAEP